MSNSSDMRRALLIMQQACIDDGHELTFKRVKARTVKVTVVNAGDTLTMTWEAYKTGFLSIECGDQSRMYPVGYDPVPTAAAELRALDWSFRVMRAPTLELKSFVSERKANAAPTKHVMNKHERKLMTQLRQSQARPKPRCGGTRPPAGSWPRLASLATSRRATTCSTVVTGSRLTKRPAG